MTIPDRVTAKDEGQLAAEQRRNARRELRVYVQECHQQWTSLSEEEKELCREAVRNLAERAGLLCRAGVGEHRGARPGSALSPASPRPVP